MQIACSFGMSPEIMNEMIDNLENIQEQSKV